MHAKGRIEARGRKHAEALNHAEAAGRHELHAHRAHQHHGESDRRADPIGAAAPVFCPGDDDHRQRQDGQQHHQRRDRHVHHILKRAGIAAVAQGKHPVADGGDPLHGGKQKHTGAQQPRLPPLKPDADGGHADHLAGIVKGAELVPERQRRGICRAEIADGLRPPIIARIGQRRKTTAAA